ncbi:MAG: pyridoxal phosphate-dependent aminotransferase [Deltaproteobacteria bacterium]|nr:pyridoxal phosphate-dependent aminotransferase [Deltaproteobacteria bacterium]
MTIAKKIEAMQAKQSWIRKMFEEGARLKAEHGAQNVFDFSLGNPNIPPPERFGEVLRDLIDSEKPGDHGYMPNVGYPFARKAVAEYLSREQETPVTEEEIIMTCGAAGALNAVLKAILDPGDEVICPAPYFVEYNTYADNHGGVLRTVSTQDDFTLDLNAVSAAVTDKTKAVLINSPNNPTGQIYSEESLKALGNLLSEKGRTLNRTLYLISDEPYRKIVYDGVRVPGIFPCYKDTVIVTSYSKDLSIPGERIGFIAVNPAATHRPALLGGLALANRILGFVNAPALMQRAVAALQGQTADLSAYARKRRLLCEGLAECGYEFAEPRGAFYLFPKSPIPDDVAFVRALQEELILAVPGSGFMGPGHFRLAFCVDDDTIVNAMPGFRRAIKKFQ